ncbi:Mtf2p Ecym_5279 [Eremothecium cymbalariae DBVPG|uniref:Mtf2-like C-terminal domain-containing protein n=1 Tax=Eremothecium cymbalariae (strain CBS 270.75 / DBVPG 7215 / KCTC 17166 / NRRL Y-17582) TaxID=931890 RepID=I6NDA0_ERECY|nr:hypothetical protein Ecym_5279 [Eremothecium cymbalariae DBVPG\
MLSNRVRIQTQVCRWVHSTKLCRKQNNPTEVVTFNEGDDVSSVKEQSLFNEVFSQMMKKERKNPARQQSSLLPDILDDMEADDQSNVQIVFEKRRTRDDNDKFKKIMESLNKNTNSVADMRDSARLTTSDIRHYPVSLTPSYFTELGVEDTNTTNNIGSQVPFGRGQTISEGFLSDASTYDNVGLDSKILDEVKNKQLYKITQEKALGPHIQYLIKSIKTDKDLLDQLQSYFKEYKRDVSAERQVKNILNEIEHSCKKSPNKLPKPHSITLPTIVRILFTKEEFNFSSPTKYNLLSMIYHKCKSSKDLSLYLQVCNVDFYNLLLKYTWENFEDIHAMKKLLSEMSVNGVMGDIYTVEIVEKMLETVKYMVENILDEDVSEDVYSIGIQWCNDTANDVESIEKYLQNLKVSI